MNFAIVDDLALFSDLLRDVVVNLLAQNVVAVAQSGAEAIQLIVETQPDAVLLDLDLGQGLSGFDVIDALRAKHCAVKILVISAHCEPYTVHRIEHSHIHGFISKTQNLISTLDAAISTLACGGTYFSADYIQLRSDRHRKALSFEKILSRREQCLLGLIATLVSDEEIALQLGITKKTVIQYRVALLSKLNLSSADALRRYARDSGFQFSLQMSRPAQLS